MALFADDSIVKQIIHNANFQHNGADIMPDD